MYSLEDKINYNELGKQNKWEMVKIVAALVNSFISFGEKIRRRNLCDSPRLGDPYQRLVHRGRLICLITGQIARIKLGLMDHPNVFIYLAAGKGREISTIKRTASSPEGRILLMQICYNLECKKPKECRKRLEATSA